MAIYLNGLLLKSKANLSQEQIGMISGEIVYLPEKADQTLGAQLGS